MTEEEKEALLARYAKQQALYARLDRIFGHTTEALGDTK